MARVRVYVKKQIRIDHMNIDQRQMLKIGTVGLASRKGEIERGLNAKGAPAKPLSKSYAIRKSRLSKFGQGKGRNKRDLRLTGAMIREFQVRTVSEKAADATFSTRKGRIKARANNAIEEFISWSPENARAMVKAGQEIVNDKSKRMILERTLNE